MATTGAPGNIPLLDDNSPITPIQAPFNATSKALNDALIRLVPRTGQARSIASDSAGQVTVNHGLGYAPYAVICTSAGPTGAGAFTYRVMSRDATKFVVKVFYNGSPWANSSLGTSDGFDWIATPTPS